MRDWCSLWWSRLVSAYMVLRGVAVAIPVFDEDTTIAVIETEGSQVNFLSCRSFVGKEDSYNMVLSKLILWICSHRRFFWTSDELGCQVKLAAEEHYEAHKKSE